MATGDLSADEATFRDLVAQETGLTPATVTAWIGSESGWNVTKPGHNYLNVGPGETYTTTAQAAARAASLINSSHYYAGIRAAIPAGGSAQVAAIGASPWGTSGSVLSKVYSELVGAPVTVPAATPAPASSPAAAPATAQNVGFLGDAAGAIGKGLTFGLSALLPDVGGAVSGAAGAAASAAGGAISQGASDAITAVGKSLGPILLQAGLDLIFAIAAFGLIAMGLNRLTGGSLKDFYSTTSQLAGAAGMAGAMAA